MPEPTPRPLPEQVDKAFRAAEGTKDESMRVLARELLAVRSVLSLIRTHANRRSYERALLDIRDLLRNEPT